MKAKEKLGKSPINYFSDLFIVAMVTTWIIAAAVMIAMGIYATVALGDVGIWSEVASLVSVPLSCGGAIWMVKNSVQHAIANSRGEKAAMDFPEVNEDLEISATEKPMKIGKEEEEFLENDDD